MKTTTRALGAILLLAVSGLALANATYDALRHNIDQAVLDGQGTGLVINVDDQGVATLGGQLRSNRDKQKILQIARETTGVTQVIDLMSAD